MHGQTTLQEVVPALLPAPTTTMQEVLPAHGVGGRRTALQEVLPAPFLHSAQHCRKYFLHMVSVVTMTMAVMLKGARGRW